MKQAIKLCEEAIRALRGGNKIEAIKIACKKHGLGLKEAKEAVEAYSEKNTIELQDISNSDTARSLFKLVIAGLMAIVAYFMFK